MAYHMYMSVSAVDKKTLRALALFVHSRRKNSIAGPLFFPVRGLRKTLNEVNCLNCKKS